MRFLCAAQTYGKVHINTLFKQFLSVKSNLTGQTITAQYMVFDNRHHAAIDIYSFQYNA